MLTDEQIGKIWLTCGDSYMAYGRACVEAGRAEALEEAAKRIVESSIDDYGSLSYCANLVRALAAAKEK